MGLLACGVISTPAKPLVSTETPLAFFTNVAKRLLESELSLELNCIQVYPSNQYTPAVHRLLQVTANIYDSTTNRTFGVANAGEGFPSVFRPFFRWTTNSQIVIAGYSEVTNADLAYANTAPPWVELDTGLNTNLIPVLGTPYQGDSSEPLVSGVPLVIGARKGFPNFNAFEMQTMVSVTRMLEFWRTPRDGNPNYDPVGETNQMYLVGISNWFGVSAWNSYSNTYPRDLQAVMVADMTEGITNQTGPVLVWGNGVVAASNRVFRTTPAPYLSIPSNTWKGFTFPQHSYSYVKYSFLTNFYPGWPGSYSYFMFQTNSSYSLLDHPNQFVIPPQTNFEAGVGFPVPQWTFNVKTRFRFMLVDPAANRLVDYVSLEGNNGPVDLADMLTTGSQTTTNSRPDGFIGSMFLTNRGVGLDSNITVPTYGIRNQIATSLGTNNNRLVWNDPNRCDAINFFRSNFAGLPPVQCGYSGAVISNVNHFFAPYLPTRNLYFYTVWIANDPLVHYTVSDLTSLATNRPNQYAAAPTDPDRFMDALNDLTPRYEPWGGSPARSSPSPTKFDACVKDPPVSRPDSWDFPSGEPLDFSWLGRVHRGTPWQTVYLKSPGIDSGTWQFWTGDANPADAQLMMPTNDWHLASLLLSLFSTNDPRQLLSVNQSRIAGWASALDGVLVLTNTLSDADIAANPLGVLPQFDTVLMQSNSPQATVIAAPLDAARTSKPGQFFREVGDVLAAPALSVASPWLNTSSALQQEYDITDEAYEAIPSQFLPRLRPDSIGSVMQTGGTLQIQFTGWEGYQYAVEISSNLLNWVPAATNIPQNGSFVFIDSPGSAVAQRFYRTVLLQ
jgi:hypothetical protein